MTNINCNNLDLEYHFHFHTFHFNLVYWYSIDLSYDRQLLEYLKAEWICLIFGRIWSMKQQVWWRKLSFLKLRNGSTSWISIHLHKRFINIFITIIKNKKKLYVYYSSFRKLMGEGLGSCSLDELQQIEQQLEKSVSVVRARKVRVSQTCWIC